jgi:hypothetical protein
MMNTPKATISIDLDETELTALEASANAQLRPVPNQAKVLMLMGLGLWKPEGVPSTPKRPPRPPRKAVAASNGEAHD